MIRAKPGAPRASLGAILIGLGILLVVLGVFGGALNLLGVVTVSSNQSGPLLAIIIGFFLGANGALLERGFWRTRH